MARHLDGASFARSLCSYRGSISFQLLIDIQYGNPVNERKTQQGSRSRGLGCGNLRRQGCRHEWNLSLWSRESWWHTGLWNSKTPVHPSQAAESINTPGIRRQNFLLISQHSPLRREGCDATLPGPCELTAPCGGEGKAQIPVDKSTKRVTNWKGQSWDLSWGKAEGSVFRFFLWGGLPCCNSSPPLLLKTQQKFELQEDESTSLV